MASFPGSAFVPALLLALSPLPSPAQPAQGLSTVGGREEAFVRLASVGGLGSESSARKVAGRVRSWSPELVLSLGNDPLPESGSRILALSGAEGPFDLQQGPVHLFSLAAETDTTLSLRQRRQKQAGQARWLRKALLSSRSPWKIVLLPESPYSSAEPDAGNPLRWPFKEWGADAVLSGGSGHYERLRIDGVTYIVNGSGAAPRSPAARLEGSLCLFDEGHGAMLVEAESDRIDFRFVTAEGLVVDSHSLRKQALAGVSPGPAVPVSASP